MTTAAAERTSMVRVHGLEKSFKEVHVLRGVDFEVASGSIFAPLGSNGAGKTTVVKILSTLLRADAGSASVNGFDVAASLIGSPRLIVLDEPTTGLDPEARHQVWRTIRQLADEGTTVLLTTQYLDEAEQLADRIAILISLAIVTGVALLIGFRTSAGPLQWLAVAGIMTLFTLALTWLAIIPGLTAKSVDGASAFA